MLVYNRCLVTKMILLWRGGVISCACLCWWRGGGRSRRIEERGRGGALTTNRGGVTIFLERSLIHWSNLGRKHWPICLKAFFSFMKHVSVQWHFGHFLQICFPANEEKCFGTVCRLKCLITYFICFYPRPVLALGYCHRLRLCVSVCASITSLSAR